MSGWRVSWVGHTMHWTTQLTILSIEETRQHACIIWPLSLVPVLTEIKISPMIYRHRKIETKLCMSHSRYNIQLNKFIQYGTETTGLSEWRTALSRLPWIPNANSYFNDSRPAQVTAQLVNSVQTCMLLFAYTCHIHWRRRMTLNGLMASGYNESKSQLTVRSSISSWATCMSLSSSRKE